MLLAIAVGSVIALPLVRPDRHPLRLPPDGRGDGGPARPSASSTSALGYLAGVVPLVVGLFVSGFAIGAWDVAMNVQGALVEQRLGRSIMSRFHAGFSIGTVAGALLGRRWSRCTSRWPCT